MAKTERISLVIEYADGRTTTISLNRFSSTSSHYLVMLKVREWQEHERIPKGTIRSVRRLRDISDRSIPAPALKAD